MRTNPNPHKGMTSPSTLNLKALGLWVFFLICCSTFSFLLNMRLRLKLGYLTISLSSESPSFTLVHSPSCRSIFSNTSTFTHLNGTRLPETAIRKTFDTGSNCTRPKPQTIDSDTTCWENPREKTPKRSQTMRTESNPHKGMTPPSTQNLKTLGLWVFFLICCSTFSFLLNVGLRLTLGYLTLCWWLFG